MSVIIYQEHCEYLERKNEELKREVLFLKTQLEFKTMGLPDYENMDTKVK